MKRKFFSVIFFSIIISYIVKYFVFETVYVSNYKMEPTLFSGDYVFLSKYAYGVTAPFEIPFIGKQVVDGKILEIGDIVVFENPENGKLYLRKITALAGNKISGKLKLPEGSFMAEVLTPDSKDDKYDKIVAPIKNIKGKIEYVLFSLEKRRETAKSRTFFRKARFFVKI